MAEPVSDVRDLIAMWNTLGCTDGPVTVVFNTEMADVEVHTPMGTWFMTRQMWQRYTELAVDETP